MARPKDYTLANNTVSDDFLLVDGATNGTRKLNAYSPTFGGNLTVAGDINANGSVLNLSTGTAAGVRVIQFGSTYNQGSLLLQNGVTSLLSVSAAGGFAFNVKGSFDGALSTTGNLTVSGSSESLFGNNGNQQLGVRIRNTTDGSGSAAYIALQSDVGFLTIYQTATSSTLGGNPTRYPASTSLFDSTSSGGIQWNANAAKAMTLASGGHLGVVGNLTVSGTGTSSVAGDLGVGTTAPSKKVEISKNLATSTVGSGELLRLIADDGNTVGRVTELGFGTGPAGGATYAPVVLGSVITSAASYNIKDFYIATKNSAADVAPAERIRVKANGNFLVGTTVDSGALLQVGTDTTTSAGGMVFGTDCNLYRSGTRQLTFLTSSSPTVVIGGTANGSTTTLKLGDGVNNDQAIITSNLGNLVFKRNTTTVLTLDTSYNATFDGNYLYLGGGTSFYLRATGSGNGLLYGNNVSVDANYFLVRNQAGSTSYFSVDSTGATFAGTTLKVTSANSALASLVTSGSSATLNLVSNAQANYRSIAFSYGATPSNLWTIGYNGGTTNTQFNFQSPTGTVVQFTETGAATFSGAIAIGNTVNTVSPTSPNRTITMVIGGTTYYIHAKTTND
jgi:hypothetical protein